MSTVLCENRDDVGEVAFPFMVLHGYKCRDSPSFVGRLEVDKYSNALIQSSSVYRTVSIENNLS